MFRALDSQAAFGNRFDLYISGKLLTEQELKKKRKNAKPAQPLVEDSVVAGTWMSVLAVATKVIDNASNRQVDQTTPQRCHCSEPRTTTFAI